MGRIGRRGLMDVVVGLLVLPADVAYWQRFYSAEWDGGTGMLPVDQGSKNRTISGKVPV